MRLIARLPDQSALLKQISDGTIEFNVQEIEPSQARRKEMYVDQAKIKDLTCSVCSLVLEKPVEPDCSDYMCQACLNDFNNANGPDLYCPSPNCECEIEFKFIYPYVIKGLQKQIDALVRKCNGSPGCEWTGTTKELDGHRATCKFQCIACPFGCNTTGLSEATMKRHYESCPNFPKICSLCKDTFPVSLINGDAHLCPEQIVRCQFDCGASVPRKDMDVHVNENVLTHANCLKTALAQKEQQIHTLNKKIIYQRKQMTAAFMAEITALKQVMLVACDRCRQPIPYIERFQHQRNCTGRPMVSL